MINHKIKVKERVNSQNDIRTFMINKLLNFSFKKYSALPKFNFRNGNAERIVYSQYSAELLINLY